MVYEIQGSRDISTLEGQGAANVINNGEAFNKQIWERAAKRQLLSGTSLAADAQPKGWSPAYNPITGQSLNVFYDENNIKKDPGLIQNYKGYPRREPRAGAD